jgi:hypothetical protein
MWLGVPVAINFLQTLGSCIITGPRIDLAEDLIARFIMSDESDYYPIFSAARGRTRTKDHKRCLLVCGYIKGGNRGIS